VKLLLCPLKDARTGSPENASRREADVLGEDLSAAVQGSWMAAYEQ
jgi:hypothetical protein